MNYMLRGQSAFHLQNWHCRAAQEFQGFIRNSQRALAVSNHMGFLFPLVDLVTIWARKFSQTGPI